MPPITFITDPSLLRKDSRSRNLLQSAANSHVAKYNHRRRRYTNLQRRRHVRGLEMLCLCKVDQPCHIHSDSSRVEVPASLRSSHSEYLSQTYGGSDENLINTLFSYYVNVAGPLYVWNFPDIENKTAAHRDLNIRLFMTEPALAEVNMAWLYWLVNPKPPGEYSIEMLDHQTKCYSLITNALGQQDKIHDYSLLWSIGGLMVLNQVCRDWESYETNLKGLNQIITLLGGLETLMNTNPLGCSYISSLQKAFADRSLHADTNLRRSKRPVLLQSSPPFSVQSSSLPSLVLPDELTNLIAQGEMRHDVAICLGKAITLLGKLRSGTWFKASSTSPKFSAEIALLDLLESRPLMFAEYTLCVGLLINLAWQPPAVEIREGLWSDPLASWLVPEFAEVAMTANLAKFKAPVLWTCLVILEMPIITGPTLGRRVSLLRDIVLEVSGQLPWRENRTMLARIYMDTKFDMLWSQCWANILRPRSLNASSKCTSSGRYGQ